LLASTAFDLWLGLGRRNSDELATIVEAMHWRFFLVGGRARRSWGAIEACTSRLILLKSGRPARAVLKRQKGVAAQREKWFPIDLRNRCFAGPLREPRPRIIVRRLSWLGLRSGTGNATPRHSGLMMKWSRGATPRLPCLSAGQGASSIQGPTSTVTSSCHAPRCDVIAGLFTVFFFSRGLAATASGRIGAH